MSFLGISKDEVLKMLSDWYQKVEERLIKPLKQDMTDKYRTLGQILSEAKAEITRVQKQAEGIGDMAGKSLDSYQIAANKRIARLEERLNQVEKNSERSGVVADTIAPKGEPTFADVQAYAVETGNATYEKIRDYFLLEMAKLGYAGEMPNFTVRDNDMGIEVFVRIVDKNLKMVYDTATYNRMGQSDYSCVNLVTIRKEPRKLEVDRYESSCGRKDIMAFEETTPDIFRKGLRGLIFECGIPNDEKILVAENQKMCYNAGKCLVRVIDDTMVYGMPEKGDHFTQRLRKDLPSLIQAYMLGCALGCIDKKDFNTAVLIAQTHGLNNNPALLGRMREVMAVDARMTNAFLAYHQVTADAEKIGQQ